VTAPSCKFPIERYPAITIAHGGGGRLTDQLIDGIFRPLFRSSPLDQHGDGAVVSVPEGRIALSTDSYVVRPLFFPGGDIGKLAVTGTCNDLSMCGARPLWLSVGMILEEGLPVERLIRVCESMAKSASEIGVEIAAGDTKVVERGKGDEIFLNTSGVGLVRSGTTIGPGEIREGDALLVSGALGRHAIAILASRQGIEFETPVVSDCMHLWPAVQALLEARVEVHAMRDLTRGGLATALIELSRTSGLELHVREVDVPVEAAVRGACEMLGLDPLYLANEGRMVVFVAPGDAGRALRVLRERDADAAHIGEVRGPGGRRVRVSTPFGTERWLEMLSGEQLPRIC
jgi:hydrogenase expression/formation protein HypE